jgi:hypothetical protein
MMIRPRDIEMPDYSTGGRYVARALWRRASSLPVSRGFQPGGEKPESETVLKFSSA